MPKTISDEKYAKAKALIETVVEPRIKEIVGQLNVILSTQGIRAGAELTWLFDELEPRGERNEEDEN